MSIRVGLIGFGVAGRLFHAPMIAAAGLELAAVASSRADEVRQAYPGAAVLPRPEELIARPDLDLVVVASPNATHHALAAAALEAGKHVVVDKPFTLTSADADRLIALAAERGRLLSVFHNRRWDSDFLTLKDCLDRGELGEIVRFQARFDRFRPAVRDRWRENAAEGGGLLFDLGPHLIDQALTLFGWPDWIAADVAAVRDGARGDDMFDILMGRGRLRIRLGASLLAAVPEAKYAVHGTRGSFVKYGMDPQEDQLRLGLRPGDAGFGVESDEWRATVATVAGTDLEAPPAVRRVPSAHGRYVDYYAAIGRALDSGGPPPVTGEEARDVIRLIELAARSAAEGQRIACPEAGIAKA